MFATMIIDCQTQTTNFVCEYCLVSKECHLRYRLNQSVENDGLTVSACNSISVMVCHI